MVGLLLCHMYGSSNRQLHPYRRHKTTRKRMKKTCGAALLILDDYLLHTITDEREVKVLFEILEKRCEINLSTIICLQREPASWSSMILNDEVSSYAIMKRASRHYTVVIKPKISG